MFFFLNLTKALIETSTNVSTKRRSKSLLPFFVCFRHPLPPSILHAMAEPEPPGLNPPSRYDQGAFIDAVVTAQASAAQEKAEVPMSTTTMDNIASASLVPLPPPLLPPRPPPPPLAGATTSEDEVALSPPVRELATASTSREEASPAPLLKSKSSIKPRRRRRHHPRRKQQHQQQQQQQQQQLRLHPLPVPASSAPSTPAPSTSPRRTLTRRRCCQGALKSS